MEPRHIIRAAIAVSVVGHLALAIGVFFADARPFDPATTRDITVDIVTPQQVAEAARQAEQTPPEPEKAPDPFRLPELTDKPKPDDPASAAAAQSKPPAPSPSAAQKPAPPPPQQSAPEPPPPPAEQPAEQQQSMPAASASSAAPTAQQPQQQAALQPSVVQPAPAPDVPRAEPDVTVKYGVMLGLPNGNGGSEAITKADIAPLDIEAFRRHLRSCATLPAAVSRGDKVRIVLRAFLSPDGRLLTEPSLIEASASAKGPLLMQAAMQALQACQPYAMLPADRYKEWKVLDLAFTPQDFSG
ncbi:MAG: hypothetical protein ABW213_14525 [Tardiphaga sp.]